jgi:site-specific recombinase XerC
MTMIGCVPCPLQRIDPLRHDQPRVRAHAWEYAFGRRYVLDQGAVAARHQRPKTFTETRRYIDQYLEPAWGDMDIRDIGKPQVFAVLDAIMDRGTEVSANRCLATMRRLFNWCVERGYLDRSPVAGIRPPAREYPRSRVLGKTEFAAVWHAASILAYPAGAWVQVMIATGGQRVRDVVTMRRSELHDTMWRIAEPTKSSAPHTVPISPLARRLLDDCPRLQGDYVFSTTAGRKHIQSLSKIKRRLDQMSGVVDWRYHDIRRTVATAFGDALEAWGVWLEALAARKGKGGG